MKSRLGAVLAALLLAPLSDGVHADDEDAAGRRWPRFRGADATQVSMSESLPSSWSKSDNVEWVAEVPGVGWSSPIVWDGRVFLTAATSDQEMKQPSLGTDFSNDYIAELRAQGLPSDEINRRLYARDREMPDEIVIRLLVLCYDLETGKELWRRQVYEGNPRGGRHRKNSYASETPVTDGENVYAYFTHHGLFAFRVTGEPLWSRPLESLPTVRDFGTGASPALHDGRVFVLNDNEEQGFLAAFDAGNGKELWRRERDFDTRRKTGWSTPFVWQNELRTEIVTLGPRALISYGLDGEELWRLGRMGASAIQSPFAADGILYAASGTAGDDFKPVVAIRAGASGDLTPAEGEKDSEYVLWYNRVAGGTYLPTPLVYDGALYVLHEKGIFARYDLETGERQYRSRIAPGASAFTASPWAYDGKIFALSEEGDTYVIEAGEEFRLLGVNALEEWSMATPALLDDRLLLRTQSKLYSLREGESP